MPWTKEEKAIYMKEYRKNHLNVDHKIPLSLFPFQDDPSLLFVASHWSNLQPLWGMDNLSKGNRYDTD